jgi:hypothetical protein
MVEHQAEDGRWGIAEVGQGFDEEDRACDRHEELVEPDRLIETERPDERLVEEGDGTHAWLKSLRRRSWRTACGAA